MILPVSVTAKHDDGRSEVNNVLFGLKPSGPKLSLKMISLLGPGSRLANLIMEVVWLPKSCFRDTWPGIIVQTWGGK